MEETESTTTLKIELRFGTSPTADVLTIIGTVMLQLGVFGSAIYYLASLFERFSYAMEVMGMLSALAFTGYLLVSRPLRLILDKETSTLRRIGVPKFSQSVRFAKKVVVLPDIRREGNDRVRKRAYYRVFIDASDEISIAIFPDLLAARQLAKQIASFLDIPLDDRSKDLSLHDGTVYGTGRRSLKSFEPRPLQVTLLSAIILMLVASILVGLAVEIHSSDSAFVPLIGPAGFVFLLVLAHALDRRR